MDRIGLLSNITISADDIYQGKKWLDIDGQEHNGRVSNHRGLSLAMETFRQIQSLADDDLDLVILAEYTFIAQELQLCDPSDTLTISSLTNAIQSFDDAFAVLKAVTDVELYKGADMSYPHSAKYRIKNMPKDAFHIMCIAHRVRINNTLRYPGVSLIEKELLKQRLVNINAAQAAYLEKQKHIMATATDSQTNTMPEGWTFEAGM